MSFWNELFGSRIQVPTYNKLDMGTEQTAALANNAKNLSASESLVGAANDFTRGQIDKNLNLAIPDYSAIRSQTSKNILSESKGEIPKDVQDAVLNSAAGKALSAGGGGQKNELVARDLGLTSLSLTDKALSSAESWSKTMSDIYNPSMMNVSSMFVTPSQQYAADESQNENAWAASYLQAQSNASADPVTQGLFNTATLGLSSSATGGGGL